MSAHTYSNTAFNANYGVKASSGTMGILFHEKKVLIIHRRLKNKEIREDGHPGKRSLTSSQSTSHKENLLNGPNQHMQTPGPFREAVWTPTRRQSSALCAR